MMWKEWIETTLKRKITVSAGLLLPVVAVGTLVGFAMSGGLSTTTTTFATYEVVTGANQRVDVSQVIVRARYIDSDSHYRPLVSPVTGEAHGQIVEQFDRYDVIELLKGDIGDAKYLYVNDTRSVDRVRTDGESSTTENSLLSLSPNDEYVLFLRSRSRLESDPIEYGPIRWNLAGVPGIATLEGDELRFIAPDDVLEEIKESTALLDDRSNVSFSMSLSDIRELASIR